MNGWRGYTDARDGVRPVFLLLDMLMCRCLRVRRSLVVFTMSLVGFLVVCGYYVSALTLQSVVPLASSTIFFGERSTSESDLNVALVYKRQQGEFRDISSGSASVLLSRYNRVLQNSHAVEIHEQIKRDSGLAANADRSFVGKRFKWDNTVINTETTIYVDEEASDSLKAEDTENEEEYEILGNTVRRTRDSAELNGIPSVHENTVKKLPEAIIIGVKKGGTRALLEFLRIHPDVRAPGPEPHFFDRHYNMGLGWYRRQMPSTLPGQVTIEKTPSYFVTREVPKRIFNMSKHIKLIVVVRNPVTRAISDYTQSFTKRPYMKPFEQMAFIDNVTRLVDTKWGAVRIGVYAKHVDRWLRYFPLEQMHFVSGERLIADPAGEMAKVQDFLGLKRIITDKHFYLNETRGFPCLKKTEGSGSPHCLGKTKGRRHPYVDPDVVQRLRDFYRPFNLKFYQMVKQDFVWT